MNHWIIICGLLLLSAMSAAAQEDSEFGAGLLLEDETYDAQPRQSGESGEKADLPPMVDLSPYCPEVRNQGEIFSCVGWAVGYGALSMERAISHGCTDRRITTKNAHSALFLYNQIRGDDCRQGSRMTDALQFLVDKGDCLASQFDFDVNNCEQLPDTSVAKRAKRYAIDDYLALFGSQESADIKILRVKKILAHKKPVIVGMLVLRNFYELKNARFWHPTIGNTTPAGGHAMVVVGYDDQKGAFRLFNSWGKNWGDNGYIWVKYQDFAKYCKYGFALYIVAPPKITSPVTATAAPVERPRPAPAATPQAEPVKPSQTVQLTAQSTQVEERAEEEEPTVEEKPLIQLSGNFEFRHLSGWHGGQPMFEVAKPVLHRHMYRLEKQDWEIGQRFQLLARVPEHNQYLYVFSIDAQGKVHFHWPRQAGLNEKFAGQNESALLIAGDTEVIVPGPMKALKLDHPGKDHLVMLFSKRKIDTVDKLAEKLRQGQGDLTDNLLKLLGKFAIPPTDITYRTDSIGFDAATRSDGFIVPLVLEVTSH